MAKKKRPTQIKAPPVESSLEPEGRWASLWVLPIAVALAFYRCFDHSLILRDCFNFFAPNKLLMSQALARGRIYEWYPWQLLGMPFVADIQSSWFYPLNLFYLVLPFEPAHRLYILVHYPLAAI